MLFNEDSGCEDRFGGRAETDDGSGDDYFDYDDGEYSTMCQRRSCEMVKRWTKKEPPAGIDCLALWNAAHAEYQRRQEAGENDRMCDVFVGVVYKALAARLDVRRG